MKIPIAYVDDPIDSVEKQLQHDTETNWLKRGEDSALNLFHQMAEKVPAYKDFLKKNNCLPSTIQTVADFHHVPAVDKDNYLRQYPRSMLCWEGDFAASRFTISTTSGSTGEPFYFPRTDFQDRQYARIAELYLRSNFDLQKKKTLYIDGFAMGSWIGGLFTYQAIRYVADSGPYPLSIITPGVLKKEILKAVINLGLEYEQVIIGGYPPMIKDVIDEGLQNNLDWSKYTLGFVFSAEGFTEEFRDYIFASTGISEIYTRSLNHYGTVDLGTMAHETPLTVLLRRIAKNSEINLSLFQKEFSQPTLAQYVPELFYFETLDENLLCSAWSGYPLFRYNLKDTGGMYTFATLKQKLATFGIDLEKEIDDAKIQKTHWNLPFVYVHERSDFVVKLYGANIYPSTIRKVMQKDTYAQFLTGKFVLKIIFDENHQQKLNIYVENKPEADIAEFLIPSLRDEIIKELLHENSEYRSNYASSPDRQIPNIYILNYEEPNYFRPGGKQKWVDSSL